MPLVANKGLFYCKRCTCKLLIMMHTRVYIVFCGQILLYRVSARLSFLWLHIKHMDTPLSYHVPHHVFQSSIPSNSFTNYLTRYILKHFTIFILINFIIKYTISQIKKLKSMLRRRRGRQNKLFKEKTLIRLIFFHDFYFALILRQIFGNIIEK